MKKILYATVSAIFALFTMSSCIDDSLDPTFLIPEDIAGDWYFKSLEFNGSVYTDCNADLNESYNTTTINFSNVNTVNQTMDVFFNCPDDNPQSALDFSMDDNIIDLYYWKFEILNAETFNGTTLELKMIYSKNGDAPINGIYTLNKQ
jgi:hypothetical protein